MCGTSIVCDTYYNRGIESELHFLFNCDAYSVERGTFLKKLNTIENTEQIDILVTAFETPFIFAKYVRQCLQIRSEIMKAMPQIILDGE